MAEASKLPVAVIIPTKNEGKNLNACLQTVTGRFAEVVVVDSGSTDRTRDLAAAAGATFVDFRWNGCFPKKRNWALRNVRLAQPWVLFLDADELVTESFAQELSSILAKTPHAGFWIGFENHFLGRRLRHGDRLRKLCLFRRGSAEYERIDEDHWSALDMEVHEHPMVNGSVGSISARLVHAGRGDLASYISGHNEYSTWEARRLCALQHADADAWQRLTGRQRWKYKNIDRWWFPLAYFVLTYIMKLGCLDGEAGLRFAMLKAIYYWHIRLKVIEVTRSQVQ